MQSEIESSATIEEITDETNFSEQVVFDIFEFFATQTTESGKETRGIQGASELPRNIFTEKLKESFVLPEIDLIRMDGKFELSLSSEIRVPTVSQLYINLEEYSEERQTD